MSRNQLSQKLFFISLLVFGLFLWSPSLLAADIDDVHRAVEDILAVSDIALDQVCIVEDARASHGYASISWRGGSVRIAVHPTKLRKKSRNTWAFIMGHELAHYNLNHSGECRPPNSQNCRYREYNADDLGAALAMRAGYNLAAYIHSVLDNPDLCSFSHGCWHERALRLARQHGIRISFFGRHNCNRR